MEEAPLVSDWRTLTKTPNVVVVPFFISDGLHSYEDIPRLLGIKERRLPSRQSKEGRSLHRPGGLEAAAPCRRLGSRTSLKEIFRQNPYAIDGRNLFYASSIGTDPGVVDIIIEQANATAKS